MNLMTILGVNSIPLIPSTQIALLIFISIFISNCANPVAPTGGPPDKHPPKLDTLQSTRNYQTNFKKQMIELTFDEWIELTNVFKQVIVSPPLEFRPKVSIRKRTVQFEFDSEEVLREEATYVINFGEAIVDLTQGNEATAIFVFSTGDYIDSLTVTGTIIDAFEKEPVEDVLFMLYENFADSVVRTERPFYFARSDENGQFTIQNVKSGIFKGVALIDHNVNYLFDNDKERIGFLDSLVVVNDSLQPNIIIELFQEESKLFLKKADIDNYGQVKLVFNQKPYDVTIEYDTLEQIIYSESDKDTLRVWYDVEGDTLWNLFVKHDTIIDTVLVEVPDKAPFVKKTKLNLLTTTRLDRPVTLNPSKPIKWLFQHPLKEIDTSLISLYQDSTFQRVPPKVWIDSLQKRQLNIKFSWKEELSYELEVLPGAVTDIFGITNVDTFYTAIKITPHKEFGNLLLKLIDLKPDTAYIVRLTLSGALVDEFVVSEVATFEKQYTTMEAGIYEVEIIEDLDQNGRWSTGHYDLKKHPERRFTKSLEELRANWDLEAEVSGEGLEE